MVIVHVKKQQHFVWLAAALAQVRLSLHSTRTVENYDRSPDGDYRRGETTLRFFKHQDSNYNLKSI